MFEELMGRIGSAEGLPAGTRQFDSHPALLSGAAFQLTDECSVWWSDPFPIRGGDEVG